MPDDLGRWEPLSVVQVAAVMDATAAEWWLSGGCALDQYLGRATREHGDIDVSMRPEDFAIAAARLTDRFELKIARDGHLLPLVLDPDGRVDALVHNIWARDTNGGPWRLQINLEPCRRDEWVYRRDPRVRMAFAVLRVECGGVPCVRPEVQLLWKARDVLPIDDLDLENVWPHLDEPARRWLADAVTLAHPDSPWNERLRP